MLVLLIIFMVTAPLITTGVVDLPTRGQGQQRPEQRDRGHRGQPTRSCACASTARTPATPWRWRSWPARVRERAGAATPTCRWSSAPTAACKYESVVRVMDTLQRAGVQRVGLSVKQGRLTR